MGDCLKHPFMDFLFWMGQDISINQIRYGQPIKNRLAIFINMDFRQYLHKRFKRAPFSHSFHFSRGIINKRYNPLFWDQEIRSSTIHLFPL